MGSLYPSRKVTVQQIAIVIERLTHAISRKETEFRKKVHHLQWYVNDIQTHPETKLALYADDALIRTSDRRPHITAL